MFSTCKTHGLWPCDPKSFERYVVQSSKNGIGSFIQDGPVGQEGGTMRDRQSLSHVRWGCKYHVVIIPRYRGEVFYGRLRRQIGPSLGSCVGGELISDN